MIRKWLRSLYEVALETRDQRQKAKWSRNYPGFRLHTLGAPTVYFDAPDRLHLGDNVVLNDAFLDLHDHIWIGNETFFGHHVAVLTGSHDINSFGRQRQLEIRSAPVRIGEGVWIASFSIVLPGTEIGSHSVVSAGSVVRGRIPPYVIVAGNPAKIVKRLDHPGGASSERDYVGATDSSSQNGGLNP